jgi:uncharacterized membrane protein
MQAIAHYFSGMIETIAKWTVILFGVFFICIGFLMLLIPAIGLILSADNSKVSDIFKIIGWFMLCTSLVLYFIPRQLHHNFSTTIFIPFWLSTYLLLNLKNESNQTI